MQKSIEKKKVDYLYDNLPSGLFAIILLLSIVHYIYLSHVSALSLHIWFFAGVFIVLLRTYSYLHYKKIRAEIDTEKLLEQKRIFFNLTLATVVHLGSGAFFVFPDELHLQIILIFFIGGLASGAAVTLATHPKLYKIYLVGSITPYAGALMLQDQETAYALSASIFIYMLFLWITASKVSASVLNNIILTLNNSELVAKLQQEVQISQEANEAKSKFLSVMSHELRTPLNAIIGFSQVLMRTESLEPKALSFIEKINISGQNLLTLVNSILDFSKISKGEMEYRPASVDFKELMLEINILIEAQIKQKNIHFTHFTSDNLIIFADKQLLKQAFINILSNAIKFTPAGGTIEFSYKFSNMKHIFCIKDSGDGISPEDIELLFEPFKQAQNAKDHLIQGTGLGLAITAKIIKDLHKGEIWVESTPGKGSAFYIAL